MSNPNFLGHPAFPTKQGSSHIFSIMPEFKSRLTFRRRCAARHSKCRLSKSADTYLNTLISSLDDLAADTLGSTLHHLYPRRGRASWRADRPTRRDDVQAFYGDDVGVPPLAFSS